MCIRDRVPLDLEFRDETGRTVKLAEYFNDKPVILSLVYYDCLLYTSDAADERSSVDLGGRRIIKKKRRNNGGGGCYTTMNKQVQDMNEHDNKKRAEEKMSKTRNS